LRGLRGACYRLPCLRRIAVWSGVLWCWLGCFGGGAARADEGDQRAKALNDQAMAEFGLGDYAPAAEHYEAAFRLKPDGALLYNAAQSHRMAGNKKRALDLYRNFVRLYGSKHPLAAEAKRRVADLERAIADDDKAAPAAAAVPATHGPPAPPLPPVAAVTPAPAAPPANAVSTPVNLAASPPSLNAPPPTTSTPESHLVSQEPAAAAPSLLTNPWLWTGVGAAIVGAVVLLVVLNPSYPNASFGQATGN
jgi:hypothetical protein